MLTLLIEFLLTLLVMTALIISCAVLLLPPNRPR